MEKGDRRKGRVVRLPVTFDQRRRNLMGPGFVPCMVSGRWLQFPKESAGHFGAGEFIVIEVMTETLGDRTRKLCELVVTRENLLRAIGSVADPTRK